MASIEYALFFGILLFLANFSAHSLRAPFILHKRKIYAFSGGVFLSYLILHILPAIYTVQGRLSKVAFVSILAGLLLVFLIDMHISRHRLKYKIRSEIREEHAVTLFVYHILIGMSFIAFPAGFLDLFLFFIPVAMFTVFSSLSIREVYEIDAETSQTKLLLSASSLVGVFLATIIPVSRVLYFPLLGFISGSILYIIFSDLLREVDKKSGYFFWGVLFYTTVIGLVWVLF